MSKTSVEQSIKQLLGTEQYSVWVVEHPGQQNSLWLDGAHASSLPSEELEDAKLIIYEMEPPLSMHVHIVYRGGTTVTIADQAQLGMVIREAMLVELVYKQQMGHERWLEGLRALTSSLDLKDLLLNIMHNVLTVIPSVDSGFFVMADEETGKLVPRAMVGLGEQIFNFIVEHGEGISGKVYNEGIGRILNPEEAQVAMQNVTEENLAYLSKAIGDDSKITAVMAVPVTMNQNKIGVMLVHQRNKKRKLNTADLHQLQGFADQAAIAISNAKLYYELRKNNQYLQKRNEIHDVFTRLSIKDDHVDKVLETIERMIGLPVLFVDAITKEGYPQRRRMNNFAPAAMFDLLANKQKPETVKMNGLHDVYLFPIVNASVIFGCIAIELQRPLQQLDHVVLEQGGAVVLLKMMNKYSLTEMYYRRSNEFFNEIVLYREPKRIEARLDVFGLPKKTPLFVCVLQLPGEEKDLKKQDTLLRQLIAEIERELGKTGMLLFGAHDKVTMLAAVEGRQKQNQMVKKLRAAVTRWQKQGAPPLYGGVGGCYLGLEQVAKSYEEANRSLTFLISRGKAVVASYADIGINRLFLHHKPEEIEDYINEVLAPLRTLKTNAEELEQTLFAYMGANRSVSQTAEALHIHPNTLYHRLRKIEEAMAIDLNSADDWLTVYLACHLRQTY